MDLQHHGNHSSFIAPHTPQSSSGSVAFFFGKNRGGVRDNPKPSEEFVSETIKAGPLDTAPEAVLDRILRAHKTYFNVYTDYAYGGRTFEGYAEFHQQSERYVLVRRAQLWEVSAHEYLFFIIVDRLSAALLDKVVDFMKTKGFEKVCLTPNHMTTYISLVVIASEVDDGVDKIVKKTRYRKNYRWGFKGWADLRVAVVDLFAQRVMTNSMGKALRDTLFLNAFKAER